MSALDKAPVMDEFRRLMEIRFTSLRELIDERDRLYKERDDARRTAVDAALAAVKEQTKASFEASEKAIVKAEEAQRAYNTAHNDLARKMEDQNKATMPRMETENRFKALEEKIALLTGSFSAGSGAAAGAKLTKDEGRASILVVVAVVSSLLAVGGVIVSVAIAVFKGTAQ